jgi:hypothetical protein
MKLTLNYEIVLNTFVVVILTQDRIRSFKDFCGVSWAASLIVILTPYYYCTSFDSYRVAFMFMFIFICPFLKEHEEWACPRAWGKGCVYSFLQLKF